MDIQDFKKKQKAFRAFQDVSNFEKIVLLALLALLLTAPNWVPGLFGIAFEVGKFGTYAIAVFALVMSAYATVQSYHIKKQDRLRALNAGKFTLQSDTFEILREYAEFKRSISQIQNERKDLWNQKLQDFSLIERRVERKQDRLGLLSANLAPELFPIVQDLYLKMLKLCSNIMKYHIDTDDLDTASNQQSRYKAQMIEEMDIVREDIIKDYSVLQHAIEELSDLPHEVKNKNTTPNKATSGDTKNRAAD